MNTKHDSKGMPFLLVNHPQLAKVDLKAVLGFSMCAWLPSTPTIVSIKMPRSDQIKFKLISCCGWWWENRLENFNPMPDEGKTRLLEIKQMMIEHSSSGWTRLPWLGWLTASNRENTTNHLANFFSIFNMMLNGNNQKLIVMNLWFLRAQSHKIARWK